MRAMRKVIAATVTVIVVGAVGLGGYALGRRTLDTHPVEPEAAAPLTITARRGSVEDVRSVEVSLEWDVAVQVLNRLPGTVTWALTPPGVATTIAAGDVVYSIDETRVLVIGGSVPAYRDIGPGSQGLDVQQVQQFLADQGYLAATPDGKWSSATAAAYRAFRKDRLLPDAASIRLGEVLFLPELPATVSIAAGFDVGARTVDGEEVLRVLQGIPAGSYLASPGSAAIPTGTAVTVAIGDAQVVGATAGAGVRTDDGRLAISVVFTTAPQDCGWCAEVPADRVTSWPATLQLVPPTAGVTVPVGAILTAADGSPVVRLAGGDIVSVSITAVVGATAVVSGVSDGDLIEIPTS